MRATETSQGARHRKRPMSFDLTQLVFLLFAALIIFGVYGRRP